LLGAAIPQGAGRQCEQNTARRHRSFVRSSGSVLVARFLRIAEDFRQAGSERHCITLVLSLQTCKIGLQPRRRPRTLKSKSRFVE
jgi:hypothetical protein